MSLSASSYFLKMLLRMLCHEASEGAGTLEELLYAALDAKATSASSGRHVTSVSINGQMTSWQVPTGHNLTEQDIAEAYSYLYDLYDRVVCELNKAGNDTPTDEEICARMKAYIVPVHRLGHSFTGMVYR